MISEERLEEAKVAYLVRQGRARVIQEEELLQKKSLCESSEEMTGAI